GDSTRMIVGTPAYVAPETVSAPERVGPAADLYAVGAVGYYLLTGQRVFDGRTSLEVIIKHVTTAPRPPSEIGPTIPLALEELLLRCLAKQPEQRPESAAVLAKLLRALPNDGHWDE